MTCPHSCCRFRCHGVGHRLALRLPAGREARFLWRLEIRREFTDHRQQVRVEQPRVRGAMHGAHQLRVVATHCQELERFAPSKGLTALRGEPRRRRPRTGRNTAALHTHELL